MGGEIQQSKCKEILLGGQKPHLSYIVMTSKPDTITLEKNLVNTGCSPKNSISAQQRKQLKCHKSLKTRKGNTEYITLPAYKIRIYLYFEYYSSACLTLISRTRKAAQKCSRNNLNHETVPIG